MMRKLTKRLRHVVAFFYRATRPFLGSLFVCIYTNQESCSSYAARQFTTLSWPRALCKTVFRVLSCNPFTGFFFEVWWAIARRKG